MTTYLETPIESARRTDLPRWGRTADGYTKQAGAPTGYLIRLRGEKRERRVMCWQFSNVGTFFVRIRGKAHIIPSHALQSVPVTGR